MNTPSPSLEKRTPTPWVAGRFGSIHGGPFFEYTNGTAQAKIAAFAISPGITDTERDANVAYALQAVNAHDALVKALEELLSVTDADSPEMDDFPDDDSVGCDGMGDPLPMTFGHLRRARAALKLAKGAQP